MIAVISIMAVLTVAAFGIYLTCNRGMSRKARGQQGRRFVIAAVVAALPAWVTGIVPMALLLALLWMVSYPLLYHLTFRRSSPDYENYGDTAFGLYLAGLLSALTGLLQWSAAGIGVVSVVEFALLVIPIVLWGYYLLYGSCIDINGMKILQEGIETNKHNFTRFLIVADPWRAEELSVPSKSNKASIVFSLPHSEGSLSQVLSIFSFYKINLTKIQSLPIIGREWEYMFYIDVMYDDYTRYRQSIDAVRPLTKQLKVLGEYVEGKSTIEKN